MTIRSVERQTAWKWTVCGLLLLATMVNYMDRQTLNQQASVIKKAFALDDPGYAELEATFSNAFAIGAITMGWMADRWSVRWVYAIAVLGWSLAGLATGLADTFLALLTCRFLLGLAEAGNWPCALKTTQQILAPDERTLGNSILQSGASLGAILTPLILISLAWTHSWRIPFVVIGITGSVWVVLWLVVVRPGDLRTAEAPAGPSMLGVLAFVIVLLIVDTAVHRLASGPSWLPLASKAVITVAGVGVVFWWVWRATRDDDGVPRAVFLRRYWVLAAVVFLINTAWHILRAWMPLFLGEQHHYSADDVNYFTSAYFVAAGIGTIAAGSAALSLARRGMTVHRSRLLVYAAGSALTLLTVAAANVPAGPLMLGLLLAVGLGTLGLFPTYYSFSQELTTRNQGKVTGALGFSCWWSIALVQEGMGYLVKQTNSYSLGIAVAGTAPALGLLALLLFWGRAPSVKPALTEESEEFAQIMSARAPSESSIEVGRIFNPSIETRTD